MESYQMLVVNGLVRVVVSVGASAGDGLKTGSSAAGE